MPMTQPLLVAGSCGYSGDAYQKLALTAENAPEGTVHALDLASQATFVGMVHRRLIAPSKPAFAGIFLKALAYRNGLARALRKQQKIVASALLADTDGRMMETALLDMAEAQGVRDLLKLAVIAGDDISAPDILHPLLDDGILSFEGLSAEEARAQIHGAFVYGTTNSMEEALRAGANVIVSARCGDYAGGMAAAAVHHRWRPEQMDERALAAYVCNILACGSNALCGGIEVVGGNFNAWQDSFAYDGLNVPAAWIHADGSAVFTAIQNGIVEPRVTVPSILSQVHYERGDPRHSICADMLIDYSNMQLQGLGENQVACWGVRAGMAPNSLLASVYTEAGHTGHQLLVVKGEGGVEKAKRLGDRFLGSNAACLEDVAAEVVGGDFLDDDPFPDAQTPLDPGATLIVTLRDRDLKKVKEAARHGPALILSVPPSAATYSVGKIETANEMYSCTWYMVFKGFDCIAKCRHTVGIVKDILAALGLEYETVHFEIVGGNPDYEDAPETSIESVNWSPGAVLWLAKHFKEGDTQTLAEEFAGREAANGTVLLSSGASPVMDLHEALVPRDAIKMRADLKFDPEAGFEFGDAVAETTGPMALAVAEILDVTDDVKPASLVSDGAIYAYQLLRACKGGDGGSYFIIDGTARNRACYELLRGHFDDNEDMIRGLFRYTTDVIFIWDDETMSFTIKIDCLRGGHMIGLILDSQGKGSLWRFLMAGIPFEGEYDERILSSLQ